jgi:hypothetical protein
VAEILQALSSGWLSNALGVIGLGVGIYLYVLSKRGPQLVFQAFGVPVIHPDRAPVKDLAITFHGHPVPGVSASYIALWNAGAKTCDSRDFVGTDPVAFHWSTG